MNDILILAVVSLLSAAVGFCINQIRYITLQEVYRDLRVDYTANRVRINRALDLVPPYSRNGNGTVQKIGKILRGER